MSEEKKKNLGLYENVLSLGLVSFFTDISSEMVFSILPSFILGLPGAGYAVLGFIEGVAEFLSYALRSISGIFSDKFRRRKVIVFIGYTFSTLTKPLFAVARTAFEVLVVRVSDRIGKAVRTSPRDALLSESVPEEQMGKVFGIHRTLDQLGAIIGPVLASSLILFLGVTVRDIFWISFIPGSLALIILIVFVKEKVSKSTNETKILQGVRSVLRGRFPLLLLVVGVFSIGAFNFSIILAKAEDIGLPEAVIPLVYATINITHVIIAIPSGMLSDRIGREKVLIIGYGAFLLSALLLSQQIISPAHIFLVALIYGLYMGIGETIQRAMVPKYAPMDLKGTAYGLYYLVVGTGFFIANTVVGALWTYAGSAVAASYSIGTSTAAIVGMILFLKIIPKNARLSL
ncbi:MFS transporter [Candidatus Bathyarchaeota archaeon]|nr:MFS transporter [Candidatus Bathyarchaeota archaeon]